MHDSLSLLRNGTRTLRGIVRELLPDGDSRDAILDLILMAYRSARDEVLDIEADEEFQVNRMLELYGCECPSGECDHAHTPKLILHGRLEMDPHVSDSSPVIKGTWVTVSHVISLIVDGWAWADVLRAHPELTEDDIRACLSYTVMTEAA